MRYDEKIRFRLIFMSEWEFMSIAQKVVHKMQQALLYPIGCKVRFKTTNYTLKGIIHIAKQ